LSRQFLLIYCALNAAFALLGLALCGAGFFGADSFGVRALAWLLSLEAGFLGAFGAVYFSFRAYRNKIEDELRAGKYDEILWQSSKKSASFISGKISNHNGESREERLEEFLIVNQKSLIYALPEGTALRLKGENATVMGMENSPVLKMAYQKETELIKVGESFKI